MIKCQVEVCAKIVRAAILKESNDGNSFLTFAVKLPVKSRSGKKASLEISVSVDGGKSEKSIYAEGRRVRITDGTLIIRKKGDRVFYNLRADNGVDLCKSSEEDLISGTMQFTGKIGNKGVQERTSKKGNMFKTFSAFSSDKDGEDRAFTWVRFTYFDPKDGEDFLKEGSYVEVNGDLQFDVYNDDISLDCLVSDVAPWELPKKQ